MRKYMKRILSIALVLVLTLGLLPSTFAADREGISFSGKLSPSDEIWQAINNVESRKGIKASGTASATEFAAILDDVAATVAASSQYRKGTMERDDDAVYWYSEDGVYNIYSAKFQAEMRAWTEQDPNQDEGWKQLSDYVETARSDSRSEDAEATRGTTSSYPIVTFLYPLHGVSSVEGALDVEEYGEEIAEELGGAYKCYPESGNTGTQVTISILANALQNSTIVYIETHGYYGPIDGNAPDRSLICLMTGTGLTTEDYNQKHASRLSASVYGVDGTAIANHMSNAAPGNLFFSTCCNGMRADNVCTPLRAKGVAVVLGFDRTVSCEYATWCCGKLITGLKNKYTVATAVANLKAEKPCDPKKPKGQDRGAYLIVASAQDPWTTGEQTVKSSWMPFTKPTITVDGIGTIFQGTPYTLSGKVASKMVITSLSMQVLSGTAVKKTYSNTPNTPTVDLSASDINNKLALHTLDPGSYTLKITAVNGAGSTVGNISFTVSPSRKPVISLDSFGTVAYGKSQNITGSVNSPVNLTSVKGEILSGSTVKQSCTVYPNATTLDLKSSAINANLKFGTLDVGSYTLKISATNSYGTTTKTLAFTIAPSAISLTEIGVATYGSSHAVIGTVTSSSNLTSVKGEILSGSTVVQSYTVKPNAKTLDLRSSAINTNLKFAKLAVGSYTLKITAVNAKGTATKSISFTVSTNLTISVDEIGNVTYGSSHNINGTVSSAAKLTSVKGEILYGTTVKQTVTVAPNAKTLNLKTSNINKNLKFGKLAKGAYILRITAVDATGTTKTVSIPFKIV